MDFSFMSDSIGRTIQVERGGPDKIAGKLIHIASDYLAVQKENGEIVYVNTEHIKNVSEPVIPQLQTTGSEPADADTNATEPNPSILLEATIFQDLLPQLVTQMIRVNLGGPNSLQGILTSTSNEYITVLHDMRDYVHYPLYHIKSITWIVNPPENNEQGNTTGNKEQGSDTKDKKKEDKEKENGSKSKNKHEK